MVVSRVPDSLLSVRESGTRETTIVGETNFGELLEDIPLYPVLLPIKNNIWSIKVEVFA